MKQHWLPALFLSCIFMAIPALSVTPGMKFWPQWRAPEATGVALTENPPVEFSETKNLMRHR